MYNDLDVITKTFPADYPILNVYAIGDVHVGSEQFNENAIRKKIDIIRNDPYGCVTLCGDLGDFGLKNYKTNVYQAPMQPKEQLEYIYELFKPITDKIISMVPGNHEERITKDVGLCPLYDLSVKWGIQDTYRENVAINKLMFGNQGNKQPNVFITVTTHGSTRNKHHKFAAGFDGIDACFSGHIHQPSYSPYGRIRVDRTSGTARHVPYKEIVVDANLSPGGYGLKHEYEIAPPPELQYLELTSYRDTDNRTRTIHKVMNYHTIQI